MKICVIGAGGFIGARVVARLAGDGDVSLLSLLDHAPFAAPAGARVFVGDFADPAVRDAAVEGADAVIHLAALLSGAAEADYGRGRRINIDATLDLFERLAPKTRMVFASTIAVYPKSMPDPVTDATPLGPHLYYGAQKLMMEIALSNFAARGRLDGVSLRPAGVVARDDAGAGLRSAFMSRLFWAVKRGEDVTLPVAPESRAWFASVETVARNFILAAKMPDLGPNRAFTLPALSLRFDALLEALQRRFPHSRSRVTFAPDPDTVAVFGSYPRLTTETADRLGFGRDTDADALVENALTPE